MTPKEKAEALVNKYSVHIVMWSGGVEVERQNVKQCALKAVDEIINEYESNICNTGYDYDFERWDMQRDYWKEVKQEIEKL